LINNNQKVFSVKKKGTCENCKNPLEVIITKSCKNCMEYTQQELKEEFKNVKNEPTNWNYANLKNNF
jgi:predicted amidophosphoribosyltransferase